jgi:hypothetical protein
MKPLYDYSGKWQVIIKEWSKGRDTIFLSGTAKSEIHVNENVRQDSASVKFECKWDSEFTTDMMDISQITLAYDWSNDRFTTILNRRPRNATWFASYYSTPDGKFANPLMFYEENVKPKKRPAVFCQWRLSKNKISMEFHERRADNNIRMRIFEFERRP